MYDDEDHIEPKLDCDGPYCLPVYKNGVPTGRVECPSDCSLCGINGDIFDSGYDYAV